MVTGCQSDENSEHQSTSGHLLIHQNWWGTPVHHVRVHFAAHCGMAPQPGFVQHHKYSFLQTEKRHNFHVWGDRFKLCFTWHRKWKPEGISNLVRFWLPGLNRIGYDTQRKSGSSSNETRDIHLRVLSMLPIFPFDRKIFDFSLYNRGSLLIDPVKVAYCVAAIILPCTQICNSK